MLEISCALSEPSAMRIIMPPLSVYCAIMAVRRGYGLSGVLGRGGRISHKLVNGARQSSSGRSMQPPNSGTRFVKEGAPSITNINIKGLTSETAVTTTATCATRAPPIKLHMFVDGTCVFEREEQRCDISRRFGRQWLKSHRVMWQNLPIIVARAIEKQIAKAQGAERFVDIHRTTVFTSSRASTYQSSPRAQMFKDMEAANFEVHMARTTGMQEKCVDIALAVEMLHYATIPDAYDLAVLVTGDKDFMPAMIRTRQKGKKVCLASMRNSCNYDLLNPSSHVRDLDVIFLEDYLHDLIVPDQRLLDLEKSSPIAANDICEVICGLAEAAGGTITSREVGRQLKRVILEPPKAAGSSSSGGGVSSIEGGGNNAAVVEQPHKNILSVVKRHFVGVTPLVSNYPDVLRLTKLEVSPGVPSTKDYVITLLEDPATKSEDVSSSRAEAEKQIATATEISPKVCNTAAAAPRPLPNLISMKKVELQRMLKERGKPISGKKTALIEQLLPLLEEDLVEEYSHQGRNEETDEFHDEEEDGDDEDEGGGLLLSSSVEFEEGVRLKRALEKLSGTLGMAPCRNTPRHVMDEATHSSSSFSSSSVCGGDHRVPKEAESELANLITLYLKAQPTHDFQSQNQGHYSGSRNVGRHLQKVKVDRKLFGSVSSALEYLKTHYGTLMNFIAQHPNEFKTTLTDYSPDGLRQYIVALADDHD